MQDLNNPNGFPEVIKELRINFVHRYFHQETFVYILFTDIKKMLTNKILYINVFNKLQHVAKKTYSLGKKQKKNIFFQCKISTQKKTVEHKIVLYWTVLFKVVNKEMYDGQTI